MADSITTFICASAVLLFLVIEVGLDGAQIIRCWKQASEVIVLKRWQFFNILHPKTFRIVLIGDLNN